MPESTPPPGALEAADAWLAIIAGRYEWTWGSDRILLGGSYNAAQLRALADFLDRYTSPRDTTEQT